VTVTEQHHFHFLPQVCLCSLNSCLALFNSHPLSSPLLLLSNHHVCHNHQPSPRHSLPSHPSSSSWSPSHHCPAASEGPSCDKGEGPMLYEGICGWDPCLACLVLWDTYLPSMLHTPSAPTVLSIIFCGDPPSPVPHMPLSSRMGC
jgi:hypothetical protein